MFLQNVLARLFQTKATVPDWNVRTPYFTVQNNPAAADRGTAKKIFAKIMLVYQ
jgi:hypothetical protein